MTALLHDTSFGGPERGVRSGLIARLRAAAALRRQRRALLAMEPHQLNDIGLTADEALAEARRRVWDVPPTWRL